MKIHQIWIGPKARPDIWMDTVKAFAQNYNHEYILWDDQKVSELALINKKWYDSELTYNGKSDILRYELLNQFGGVYIDADMVIINGERMNTLIKEFNTDCAFGFEVDNKLICGAVMIAVQGSKFVQKCIEEVPLRDMSKLAWLSIGPKLITDLYSRYKDEIPITVYKSVVFYPIRWHGIKDINIHTQFCFLPETATFQYGYSTNSLESCIGTK
jgi:mannosyltransferase OCH1-like enzyme|uniref:Glycosyltransferase n=1 Tax=viral metagenome TaxID=1070528 RepID=A0A6C0B1D4_9ZZZZ